MQYFPESFNGFAYGPSESPIYLEYLIAFIVFVVAASTDALDGYLARKNNQIKYRPCYIYKVCSFIYYRIPIALMTSPKTMIPSNNTFVLIFFWINQ